jgi:hypothetical protein
MAVPTLATTQSALTQLFSPALLAQSQVKAAGRWLYILLAEYSSVFVSSYLATLDPNLTVNQAEGYYIAIAQPSTTGST